MNDDRDNIHNSGRQPRAIGMLPRFRGAARAAALVGLLALSAGCTAVFENDMRADLSRDGEALGPDRGETDSGPRVTFSGKLEQYVDYALKNSPALHAAYDDWEAASYRITPARALPEPKISYAYFIRRVETRVGPQRHRVSVSQAFPWPTKLTAAADAAALGARAAQRRFDATGLAIARRVASAYWKLWLIHRTRRVVRDQIEIVRYMSGAARGRIEVGKGGLADLGQVDLSLSRMTDMLGGLDEQQRQASAELIAAVGAPPRTATPVEEAAPPLLLPVEDDATLRAAVSEHPQIDALDLMAQSRAEQADSAEATGYPTFGVGLTWIETGGAAMPNVADSGKDPLIVSLTVSLPIWRGAYAGKADEAHAQSAAFRARKASATDEAIAALDKTLAQVRDATRRVKLYRTTLVPQAEAVYGAVLGGYQVGDSNIASGLLAERELLELQLALFRAQADHAIAWARLEELAGRSVKARVIDVPDPLTQPQPAEAPATPDNSDPAAAPDAAETGPQPSDE